MGKYGIVIEDSEQGLYYVRARYYNASIGRFLSEDPIWSTNLYAYSGNNPLKNIDPSGKCFDDIFTDDNSWNEDFRNSTHNSMFESIGIEPVFEEGSNICGRV